MATGGARIAPSARNSVPDSCIERERRLLQRRGLETGRVRRVNKATSRLGSTADHQNGMVALAVWVSRGQPRTRNSKRRVCRSRNRPHNEGETLRSRPIPLPYALLFVLTALHLCAAAPDSDVRETGLADYKTHFKMPDYQSRKEWETRRQE